MKKENPKTPYSSFIKKTDINTPLNKKEEIEDLKLQFKELKEKYNKLEKELEIQKAEKSKNRSETRLISLIEALSSANLAAQKVHTKDEVFEVVARELKKLDMESVVLIADENLLTLEFNYYSYHSRLMKIAEKAAKMTIDELKLAVGEVKEFEDVINRKKTVLVNNSAEFIRKILPDNLKFMTSLLTKLFNIKKFILTPLIIEDKTIGVFSVQSDDLVESDIPEVTMFACQLAGAWHKSELLEKANKEIVERKEIEQALKNSEEMFAKAFELSPYIIGISDLENGRYIDVNENFIRISGYKKEEIIGKTATELGFYVDNKLRDYIVSNLNEKGKIKKLFSTIRTRSGEIKSVNIFVELMILKGRRCILAILEDLTEQKLAEKKLNESVRKTETLINNLPGAVFRSLIDRDWTMEYISNGIIGIAGYPPSDFIGNNIRTYNSIIIPEDSDSVWEDIQKSLKENTPYTLEYKIKTSTGKIKWVWERGVGIFEKGELIAIEGYITDITEKKKAEEENILLASTVRSVKDAISITDTHNNFIFVNEAFLETYGYSEEDLIGKSINILIPRDRNGIDEIIRKETLKGGWHGELVNTKKDGTNFPIELWTSVVRDENGKELATVGVARDITGRKKIEKEIKEANDKFIRAQRVAKVGSWEDHLPTGKLTWSKEMYRIFEIEENSEVTLTEILKVFPEEEFKRFNDAVKASVYDHKPYSMDYKIIMADGRVKYIHDEGEIKYDENGEAIWMFGTTQDITERTLAYERLYKSEKRFSLFFSQSLDGYYYTQLDEPIIWNDNSDKEVLLDYAANFQRIVEVNDAMLLQYGTTRESLIGKPVSIFFEHETEYGREIRKKLFNEGRLHLETKERKFDGTNIWIEGDYVCLYDSERRITGTFGIQRDITERKKTEIDLIHAKEKAEEMNRVKSSFLANMSHEVRTPLVAILGFSELLGDMVKEPEIKNFVDMIHAGGVRLLDTLNLILDLSIIESQKMTIRYKEVDITKEIKSTLALFEKFADKKNLKLVFKSEYKSLVFASDEKIIRQILNNLINNGIKYTSNGGVTVTLQKEISCEKHYICIKVEDTGIGIPIEKQKIIWEEFRQASEGLNRSFEGAGLGLSITKKFVEKLGGKITLEKSEVGIGSVFKVVFPVEENVFWGTRSVKEKEINTDRYFIKTEKYKPVLLYIDDDKVSLDLVLAYTKEKFVVETANNGKDGFEKAKSKKYDAILIDIFLGGDIDGIQLVKMIRSLDGYSNLSLAAITAFAMVGDKERFLNYGFDYYLSKPFGKTDLLLMLEKMTKK